MCRPVSSTSTYPPLVPRLNLLTSYQDPLAVGTTGIDTPEPVQWIEEIRSLSPTPTYESSEVTFPPTVPTRR